MSHEFDLRIPISKREPEGRVFGWAYQTVSHGGEPIVDHSGEVVGLDELEKAFAAYALESRAADVMHQRDVKAGLTTLAVLTPALKAAIGTDPETGVNHLADFKAEGAFVGYQVDRAAEPELWDRIEKGELAMFSIRGEAQHEPMAKTKGEKREAKTRLTNLRIDAVGFVDTGDNPTAFITLWKRGPKPSALRRLITRKIGAPAAPANDELLRAGLEAAKREAMSNTKPTAKADAMAAMTAVCQSCFDGSIPPEQCAQLCYQGDDPAIKAAVLECCKLCADQTLTAEQCANICAQFAGQAPAAPADGAAATGDMEGMDMGKGKPITVEDMQKSVDAAVAKALAAAKDEREAVNKAAAIKHANVSPEKLGAALLALRKADPEHAATIEGVIAGMDKAVDPKLFMRLYKGGETPQADDDLPPSERLVKLSKKKMAENKGMDYAAASRAVLAEDPDLAAAVVNG